MRLLIVDDDPKFRTYISSGLQESGIETATAADGEAALSILKSDPRAFDLILLDVMMPAKTGWDLLMEIRQQGRETPVIFVTARDSVEERVKGLRLGADDYVIKPFAFNELVARIEAVIRRRKSLAPIEIADLRLDLAKRQVLRSGKPIDLSPREFDLLLALARANGKVLTRADLLRDVWSIDFDPGTNVVDVHIGRLRRKLGREGSPLIHTVRGEGYRFSLEHDGS
ncbi:MAG: response regulator transcription factor [Planctomycetes bacterium]|nr:response regulator transcription factor [Planctomycetota bacterium]MCC6409685.1 response regulator transcription factor [Planctomycetota bacterium]